MEAEIDLTFQVGIQRAQLSQLLLVPLSKTTDSPQKAPMFWGIHFLKSRILCIFCFSLKEDRCLGGNEGMEKGKHIAKLEKSMWHNIPMNVNWISLPTAPTVRATRQGDFKKKSSNIYSARIRDLWQLSSKGWELLLDSILFSQTPHPTSNPCLPLLGYPVLWC